MFAEYKCLLFQVSQLTGHLVYWAKATVIYPLCEGNVYVVAPGANINIHSPLVDEFAKEFLGLCLLQVSLRLQVYFEAGSRIVSIHVDYFLPTYYFHYRPPTFLPCHAIFPPEVRKSVPGLW